MRLVQAHFFLLFSFNLARSFLKNFWEFSNNRIFPIQSKGSLELTSLNVYKPMYTVPMDPSRISISFTIFVYSFVHFHPSDFGERIDHHRIEMTRDAIFLLFIHSSFPIILFSQLFLFSLTFLFIHCIQILRNYFSCPDQPLQFNLEFQPLPVEICKFISFLWTNHFPFLVELSLCR